jgi:transcriptional regulator
MYIPKHFSLDTAAAIAQLGHSDVVDLVTMTDAGLVASTIPMLYVAAPDGDGLGTLHGHVARGNPQWKTSRPDTDVLAIANGANAYVSPSAYPSKQIDGKVVPTWNYSAVHAYGTLIVHDDAEWTRDLVRRLTDHHELRHGAQRADNEITGTAWSITDAPVDYIDSMLRAIVGIEIQLTRVEGKSKLSQNKPIDDRVGVINDLAGGTASEHDVSVAMNALLT